MKTAKKLLAIALMLVMVMSLGTTAFAAQKDPTEGIEPAELTGEKLVIWTLADDLISFGARYQALTGAYPPGWPPPPDNPR